MASSARIEVGTIDDLVQLEAAIPEFGDHTTTREEMERRLAGFSLILVARVEGEMAGFKAGWALSPDVFYSWIGGVLPQFRRQGIAQALLDGQEAWARARGYRAIQVRSMNRFLPMLRFLLKNHYLIIGYEERGDKWTSKIRFEKELQT